MKRRRWSLPVDPVVGASVALAGAILTVAALQVRSGVWDRRVPLVVGLGLLVSAALAPIALRPLRGLLPGLGLTAVAVAHALVTATTSTGSALVLVLAVWVPFVALGLALVDEAQRAEGEHQAPSLRGHDPGGTTRPVVDGRSGPIVGGAAARGAAKPVGGGAVGGAAAVAAGGVGTGATAAGGSSRATGSGGRRALTAGLAAAVVVSALAAAATVFIRPPSRSGGPGDHAVSRFWSNVARSGRPASSLSIYQSSDELDTGRRVSLGDEIVMRVRAEHPDYWRGTSYDGWDGRTWTRTRLPAGTTDPTERPAGGSVGSPAGPTPLGEESMTQVFTIVAGGSDLLFGAYRARGYVSPEQYRADSDGTTTVAEPLGPGARYAVMSSRPVVTADLLRQLDPVAAAGRLPPAVRQRYLQLPDAVPDRVLRLAAEVAGPQPTAYDKIEALEQWMGDNTTYTLDLPPLPQGADAVDQFLFVDRRGYCEQIATSLTVMLRSLGVPARLGVGYAPGERRWGSDEYVVRSRDAHAWVEVWFPGVGWQAFDPTANVPLSGESSGGGGLERALLVGGAAVAVVVLAALAARRVHRHRARSWEAKVLARLEAAGRRRGRPRDEAETAAEYAAALGGGVLADARLVEVGAVLSRSAFGPLGVDREERRRVEQIVDQAISRAPGARARVPTAGARR